MKFEDFLNETENDISFERISEPRTKEVRLRIVINKGNPTDLLTYPHPDSKVTTLQIDFPNYVTYSVIYDDFTIQNDDEIYQGETFRIYQKSNFLNFVLQQSMLSGKKLKHFSLACIEHKVDIISSIEPIVTLIDSKDSSTNAAG